MGDVCTDGRFDLIERFKRDLVEDTNIETSPEEMAVLDSILFRMWQMGWLDKLAASPWHRVEEPPKDGQECLVAYSGPTDWIYEHATYHSDLNKALEEDIFIDGTDGFIVDGDVGYDRHSFNYWMPIEPPTGTERSET